MLQGKTSFLGQYAPLDVVIMTRRGNDTNDQLPRNQHTVTTTTTHTAMHTFHKPHPYIQLDLSYRPARCPSACLALCVRVQLPPPFDTDEVRGDILLVRMDKNSEPQPLTLAEWQQFCDAGGNVPADSARSGEKRAERDGEDDGKEADQAEEHASSSGSSSGVAHKKQRKT